MQLDDDDTSSVSIMVSYITSEGVKLLEDSLRKFSERNPGKIRVIASTHQNITEPDALETLIRLGANVRVSYDVSRTRFHGKAWVFEKSDKNTLVHVGSSNWTATGLAEGEELNILTEDSNKEFLIYFNQIWEQLTDLSQFQNKLSHLQRSKMADLITAAQTTKVDILRPFQRKLLDQIKQNRSANTNLRDSDLLVAATGTGKTVISSVDFKELREVGEVGSMLYIAHRREILEQAIETYRFVLNDMKFGNLQPDIPTKTGDAFLSIQWLSREDNMKTLEKNRFDYIVIDEAHHADASMYRKILSYFEPKYLLGLTATPERYDGGSILDLFGGKISAELRLWDAVREGYLAKFKYYAVDDHTDLSNLSLTRGQYKHKDLENLYLNNNEWLNTVYKTFLEQTRGFTQRKVLGFCPTVEVSKRVADYFTEQGVQARHIDGGTKQIIRDEALKGLKDGGVEAIFSVDLLNEGLDIPEVNIVLLLRPTASPTVFVQQIGRGLRRKDDDSYCTIVDYVGNNNQDFDLGSKFMTLIPAARARLIKQKPGESFEINLDGCTITLTDDIAQNVLVSLQRQLTSESLSADLSYVRETNPDASLYEFLQATGVDVSQLYTVTTFTEVESNAVLGNKSELSDVDKLIGSNLKKLVLNHRRGAPMFDPSRRFLQGITIGGNEVGYVDALCRVLIGNKLKEGKKLSSSERRDALLKSTLASEVEKLLGLLAYEI